MNRLYANTVPFYVRHLSILRFGYMWNKYPQDTEDLLYLTSSSFPLEIC
jgi:hypothetical protein